MTLGAATEGTGGNVTEPRAQQGAAASGGTGGVRSGTAARPTRTRPGPVPQPPPTVRLWGTRPGRLGVFTVIGAVTVGMLITILADSEPGLVLGIFLVLGTVVAVLAVRPEATYVVFPVPAAAYTVAAVIAGLVHDHAIDTSRTALALSLTQWIASGFVAMVLATGLAVLIAGYRWLRKAAWPPGGRSELFR